MPNGKASKSVCHSDLVVGTRAGRVRQAHGGQGDIDQVELVGQRLDDRPIAVEFACPQGLAQGGSAAADGPGILGRRDGCIAC